jgi:Cys-rich protein (TIGR01571 family)
MDNYYKFSNYNHNYFNPLLGCFENLCSCSMGLFFPSCLFGRIYEKADFGKCWIGCCKLLLIQITINFIFSIIIYSTEYIMIFKKQYDFNNKLNFCYKHNSTCESYVVNFDDKSFYNNKCILNSTFICECSKNVLVQKCHYDLNILPNDMYNLFIFITIISLFYIIALSCFTGLFLGNYRNKISHKYNILYNSRYNFLIHCIPFTNQCALCQEYNSIERIELIKPLQPNYKINL